MKEGRLRLGVKNVFVFLQLDKTTHVLRFQPLQIERKTSDLLVLSYSGVGYVKGDISVDGRS